MSITASCGHDISGIPFEEYEEHHDYTIMDFARDGGRIITYGIACKSCKEKYKEWGILLTSEEDENAYLKGLIAYPHEEDK